MAREDLYLRAEKKTCQGTNPKAAGPQYLRLAVRRLKNPSPIFTPPERCSGCQKIIDDNFWRHSDSLVTNREQSVFCADFFDCDDDVGILYYLWQMTSTRYICPILI